MGRSKPLLPWGDRSLLAAWIARFRGAGFGPIAVVCGDDIDLIRSATDEPNVLWVSNPDVAGTGPRESLLLALDALPADRPAWFTPVDVPVAPEDVLIAVRDGYVAAVEDGRAPLAALPTHNGADGHPVLAGPDLIQRLYEGERGDRIDAVFAWASRRLVRVTVDAPQVCGNMNRPEDYMRFAAATSA
jgi:CTP:molybdopterin cytidylyltransferase MocA